MVRPGYISEEGDKGRIETMHESEPTGHSAFPFTTDEKRNFQNEDLFAARIVVTIITAIFLVGVALYTFVAWTVAG